METLVGLYECLQNLKGKLSQSERLPEYIMEKKVTGTETLLWFSILSFPLETALWEREGYKTTLQTSGLCGFF